MKNKNKGIYVHVPFCARKCNYCDFLSFQASGDMMKNYIEALVRELQLCKEEMGRLSADSVYIGGGTPSILRPELMEMLLAGIEDNLSLSHDCEFTVECNPGTLDKEKIKVLHQGGVNRISLGVQSMDDSHLKRLGRIHNRADVFSSINLLKLEGFDNINLDLMFSLPDQTPEDWDETVRKALWFDPAHISFYGLTLEEGTPMYDDLQQGRIHAYEDDEDRKLYYHALELLEEKGLRHYEISNAAKPGMESRHNLKYWTMMDYIGFGLGAHSFNEGIRFSNPEDIGIYTNYYLGRDGGYAYKIMHNNTEIDAEGIFSGSRLIREWVHKNTERENIEEFMFTGLRLVEGISCEYFRALFGKDIEEVWGSEIDKLTEHGFMERAGDRIRFTSYGMDLANVSLMEFV